jgi:DNA-binding LacI/PurR family transcriptional regulator
MVNRYSTAVNAGEPHANLECGGCASIEMSYPQERRTARRVTIRDVAREAGVSPATVSNWLNGRSDGFSAATAEVVATTAERLGYRPSSVARALRGSRTNVLGLIVPSVAHPSMPDIVRGAEVRAREAGCSLFLTNIDRHWEMATESTLVMLDRGVEGIGYVFSVDSPDHPAPQAARAAGAKVGLILPFAGVAYRDAITLDNGTAMREVAQLLWNLGHRRIGFASTTLSTANGPHRLASLRAALSHLGGELPDAYVAVQIVEGGRLDEALEIDAGRQAAIDVLSRSDAPTAIVAVTDTIAVGVLLAARDLALRVPADLSVVGFDDLAIGRICDPPLTTLALPRERLGRDLTELLVGDNDGVPRRPVVPTLVVRGSTGRAMPRSH